MEQRLRELSVPFGLEPPAFGEAYVNEKHRGGKKKKPSKSEPQKSKRDRGHRRGSGSGSGSGRDSDSDSDSHSDSEFLDIETTMCGDDNDTCDDLIYQALILKMSEPDIDPQLNEMDELVRAIVDEFDSATAPWQIRLNESDLLYNTEQTEQTEPTEPTETTQPKSSEKPRAGLIKLNPRKGSQKKRSPKKKAANKIVLRTTAKKRTK